MTRLACGCTQTDDETKHPHVWTPCPEHLALILGTTVGAVVLPPTIIVMVEDELAKPRREGLN